MARKLSAKEREDRKKRRSRRPMCMGGNCGVRSINENGDHIFIANDGKVYVLKSSNEGQDG